MADLQTLYRALENADAAGDVQAATQLANYIKSLEPQAPAPVQSKERSYKNVIGDIGAGLTGGVGSLIKLPGQLYGLATGNMEKTGALGLGEDIVNFAEEMKSSGLKAREAERAKKIAEAEKEGQLSAFGTAFSQTIKDPALLLTFLAEQAPQLLIPFGAGRVAGAIAKGLGAAEAVVGKAAVSGAVGAGAVQQGADIGEGAYENIYKELIKKGVDPKDAAEGALRLARQAGASGAVISLLVQRLPGARMLEESLAGVASKQAPGIMGRLRTATGTAAGETISEIPEEVGGKLAQNIAMQQVKPEQSLTEGLGQTAAMAALGAVGMGGATGLARSPQAPQVAPETGLTMEPTTPAGPTAIQQRIEEQAGVRAEEAKPELLTSEEAGRQRINMLQQKVDADAEAQAEKAAREGIPPDVPIPERTDISKPSINEQMPQATSREELLAKQAEIDKLRLEAGLPTGESSLTPGVKPAEAKVEDIPVPKIVDNRPLEERAANNRLLVMRNMLKNQGGDPNSLTIIPHPTAEGRFAIQSLDVPTKFTNLTATAINKPVATPIIDPVNAYIEIARRTNTPASMRLVKDFEAGIVTREDVQAAIEAEHKAGQPLPLNYQGNGEPWFIQAPTYKPRGERFLPPPSIKVETPVEEPPVETPEPPNITTNEMPKTLAEFRQRMPIESDKPEIRSANKAGDFTQLAAIMAQSPNPAVKRIGQLSGAIAKKIKLRKPGRMGAGIAGQYRYADDSIQMHPDYAGDEHTNAHETLHALISKAQRYPNDRQKPIAEKIVKLYKYVKQEMVRQGKGNFYGLTNEREFTAEAMTNPAFQFELMNIQYGGRQSAWTAFTKLVADLLGIKNTNALTEVMNLVDRLAQTKTGKQTFDKTAVDYANETDQLNIPTVQEVKEKVSTALQKRKPIPASSMEGLSPEITAAANRVFNPRNETVVEKIDGMRDGFWKRLAQGVADQYRTIKDYTEEGYMLARMSKTVDGALESLMFYGQVFLDGGALNVKQNTKGMLETLKPVGKEVDRYQMWVALNREARLPMEKRSRSDDMDFLVAKRKELMQGTIDGKPREEVYKNVLREMNILNKSVLDVARQQGLIDDQAYEVFSNDIYYIPFYRQMEDGDIQGAQTASGLARQQFSQALKGGGERPFGDLMENTLRNWSHILSASMKNKAAVTTIRAAEKFDAVQEVDKAGNGAVKVMEDGKPKYYAIKDALLLEAITSIGYMGPKSKYLDVARDFKNILQYGVTLSPIFKVNNLTRDSVSAMAVSGLKKNPFANIVEGWIASDQNNPAHISALTGGAIFNFGSAYEGNQAKLIKKLLAKGVKENQILDTDEKIKNGLSYAWDKYQEWGNKSEAANRMALYNQLREKGLSHLEASFQARDLLDFSMQGAWPAFRFLTQVVPFMNARIQGLYKLGRDGITPTSRVLYNTLTGKEISGTDRQKAESFTIISTATMLASMALYMAFKDDEEFQKRDAWDRDNFWWIRIPGMDYALRIPKPFEIGAFGTIAERTLEQIVDSGAEGKQFSDSLSRMLWDTFSLNPTPQFFKPLVDLYANKDNFTGAPIESAGMERLSKEERKTDSTSPLAIAASKVLNIALPERAELSPVQTDYAIKAYFGWLGSTVASASQYAVMPFNEGEYPDAKWMDRAALGLIKELPANQSRYTTAFYENNKQISQAFQDMRHYAEIGDSEKVQQILEEKGDLIGLEKLYDQTSKQMANVRRQATIITNDKNMDGATKREEIDRLKEIISELAKQAEQVRKDTLQK